MCIQGIRKWREKPREKLRLKKIGSRGLHVATSVVNKKLKRFGMQPGQDRRSPMLLFLEHYSSWYWLMLVAILDCQYQLLKTSECLLIHIWCCLKSKHVKVHMKRNFFDCFRMIIVLSIYFSIFRQFHRNLTILWACKYWVFAWKLRYSNRAATVPRDLDCDVVLLANSQTQHKIWQS